MTRDRRGALVMIRAHAAGRAAARAGTPARECPYDLKSADPVTRAQALLWHRGHDQEKPIPVDYSG